MRKRVSGCVAASAFLWASLANAGVEFDGSMGPTGTLSGDMDVNAAQGTLSGENLFHSFTRFDVLSDETLTFSGPDAVSRIIGRVTGGFGSTIDGWMGSSIPNVSLYLFNPAGVAVGSGAEIDIPSGFYLSTADLVMFPDGGVLDTGSTEVPAALSVAVPSAFGFVGTPAALTVDGLIRAERISLIGGDLNLTNPTLFAPGGRVDLIALSDGTVTVGDGLPVIDQMGPGGDINLTLTSFSELRRVDGQLRANVDTTGAPNGPIYIRGQQFTMGGGFLFADSTGGQSDTGIDVVTSGDVELSNGARLTSDRLTDGDGAGGGVSVTTPGELRIQGSGSGISARALASGEGGTLNFQVGRLTLSDDASLSTSAAGSGAAGDVLIVAGSVTLGSGGRINASSAGQGDGGSVLIDADEVLIAGRSSTSGADAGVDVVSTGQGLAGDIRIQSGRITIGDGGSLLATTFSDVDDARGGAIRLAGDELVMSGGSVEARTVSPAGGGDIEFLAASRISLADGFSVRASTDGPGGAGGTIRLAAPEVSFGAGNIVATSDSAGGSGSIEVTGDEIAVNGTTISAASNSTLSDAGAAGAIVLSGSSVRLVGADVSTSIAGGSGATTSGDVQINAAQTLSVSGDTQIAASTTGAARGGRISLSGGSAAITDSSVLTNALGAGDSGDIVLSAGQLVLTRAALDTDAARSTGGSVQLAVDGTAQLSDARVSASAGADGAGGDLDVSSDLFILERSSLLARADAGNGGQIDLAARGIIQDFDGVISADSNTGTAGTVDIAAPEVDVSAAVQSQRADFQSSQELARDPCSIDSEEASSLIVQPRPSGRAPEDFFGADAQRSGC